MFTLRLALVLIALAALTIPINRGEPTGGVAAPDVLARWAAANGVKLPIGAGFTTDRGARVTPLEGESGIAIAPAAGKGSVLRRYLVRADRVQSGLGAAIRAAMFPGGSARLAPTSGGDTALLGEAEIEDIYLALTSVEASARCRDPDRLCEAVQDIAVLAKLRGVPLVGPSARAVAVPLGPLVDPLAFAETESDPQQLCGFDPGAARVPHHIAGGCTATILMRFAGARDFALDGHQRRIVPLTQTALARYLREAIRQGLVRGGVLRGGWVAGIEAS
ncbi:hypothetical protein [Sphingosinithalassobacter portus]|uniref:hypothetical protein n=1 Tax=Stakelama portus TaxID=2676234 RepID=UPI000D6DD796|nr:hypothetical protein [Sphingosinithalassobacter portus]